MHRFDGRVAIVTGAASGVGAATSQLLASRGAAVAVADIDDGGAEQVAATIQKEGGRAFPVHLDVAVESDWAVAAARIAAELGQVTLLHSNAALISNEVMQRDVDLV